MREMILQSKAYEWYIVSATIVYTEIGRYLAGLCRLSQTTSSMRAAVKTECFYFIVCYLVMNIEFLPCFTS